MRKLILTALVLTGLTGASGPALASSGVELLKPGFSWEGVFGKHDPVALKRGFQTYRDVCANCHGLRLVAYRNLSAVGLSEDEIKAMAAQREVPETPLTIVDGKVVMRKGLPSDRIASNMDDASAMTLYQMVPPDLSLMNKARAGGPNYVYSLLMGYVPTPEHLVDADHKPVVIPEGKSYNPYFPGFAIGMPEPISGEMVYEDKTKVSKEQAISDVVTFLNWAAEPELDQRKSMGVKVMVFLGVLTALMYALKVQIWKKVH